MVEKANVILEDLKLPLGVNWYRTKLSSSHRKAEAPKEVRVSLLLLCSMVIFSLKGQGRRGPETHTKEIYWCPGAEGDAQVQLWLGNTDTLEAPELEHRTEKSGGHYQADTAAQ